MVREIMTDNEIARAEAGVAKRGPSKKKSTMVRYERPWRGDTPTTPEDTDDRLMDQQRAGVDRVAGMVPGFVAARPRADRYVYVLLRQLTELDADAGASGHMWYETNRNNLTVVQGSEWISRLKAKIASYAGAPIEKINAASHRIPRRFDDYADIVSANYALETDKTHFYRVSRSKPDANGRVWVRVKERASDELFPVRPWRRAIEILNAIRTMGPEASGRMFADRLGRCRNCFKSLTDDDNEYKIYGYGPDCGPNCMTL